MQYVCSLPNPGVSGAPHECFTDDPAKAEAFARREDRPGRGVFDCVNPLRDGARSRNKENVAAIVGLHVDIDFRDILEDASEVDRRLTSLPCPPTELRASGGGRHAWWRLDEPISAEDADFSTAERLLKRLTEVLCGDLAPAHVAALLRRPGTHNSKRTPPVRCEVLSKRDLVFTLVELEAMLDLIEDQPVFTRRLPNGEDKPTRSADAPVDIESRLAAMRHGGPGDSAIHPTQLACTASLIRHGLSLELVTAMVLEATRRAVAADPRCASWDWAAEESRVWRMAADHINKNPELAFALPEGLRQRFEEATRAGLRPRITRNRAGPHVRIYGSPKEPPRSEDDPVGEPGKSPGLELHPFRSFDLASLSPRRWLYGKHFQRRTVSATIAPGGAGKTSLCMVEAAAMATCRNLLGEQPTERLRVWYHNGEDSVEELNRRLGAICLHYGIPQEELQGWFFLTSGTEVPLRVAKGYTNLEINDELIRQIHGSHKPERDRRGPDGPSRDAAFRQRERQREDGHRHSDLRRNRGCARLRF